MAKKKNDEAAFVEEEKKNTEAPAEETSAEQTAEAETVPDKEAQLEKALADEKEKYLRLAAEYDNYRKRSAKEREGLYDDIKADTVSRLFPVYDNLERALAQKCTDEAFYKGIEMTMNQLRETFEKLGITEIPALGQQFDPEVHNAVMHVDDENAEANVVVEEFQKGFKLGNKVVRFSMVKVAN